MEARPVSVAFNATALLSPLTGIGHYARSLALALAATGETELHYFYGLGWSDALRDAPVRNIVAGKSAIKRAVPKAYELSRFVLQRFFAAGVRRRRCDLYHDPNFLAFDFDGPTVITAHDLSWLHYPETHPAERVRAMQRLFPRSLQRAAHVITDAESVRREIIDTFAVAPERITAVPLAARAVFRPATAEQCAPVLARHGLSWRGFVLCVGTLEPRKNLELALRAYAALPASQQDRLPLAIVGMKGWLTSRLDGLVEPLARSGRVRPVGYVDDEALAALCASARMLVYPSLYEGFGLPPLEAMACGTPVIASNVSSLPEVVGDAGIQVGPHDVAALRAAMAELSEDDGRWEALRSAGLARAAGFSWARCARETLAVYRKVLS
jgi:alpha-1,3-rhamnosyl/mannosyltransferase